MLNYLKQHHLTLIFVILLVVVIANQLRTDESIKGLNKTIINFSDAGRNSTKNRTLNEIRDYLEPIKKDIENISVSLKNINYITASNNTKLVSILIELQEINRYKY